MKSSVSRKNVWLSTALACSGVLSGAAVDLVSAQARSNAPAKANAPVVWPWGAKVDESVFAPGGAGVTIHAAPTRAEGADGSAAKPYDLNSALKQAQETVREMESDYQRLSNTTATPTWLRIARRGNEFAAFSAPDVNGKPGAWTPAGEAKTIAMPAAVHAGLLVTSSQAWPQNGTFAGATFDNVTINGQKVSDAAWNSHRVGIVRGIAETAAAGGQINIKGNGLDANWGNNWEDSGQYAYVPFLGDGEVIARLSNLTPSTHSKNASAALVVREALTPGARMMELEVAAKGDNSGLWRGFRADRAVPGKDVRVVLAPGVYRSELRLFERDEVAQGRTLVIEGAKQNGQTGGVIISGSEEWKPETWKDEGHGTYSREWTRNWGGAKLEDRRELIFITLAGGSMQRLQQVLIADWKAAPGTYAVDEEKDRIIFRLPTGLDATRFNNSLVEVATHDGYLLGFGTMNSRSDDNMVLRNLTFQHNAGHGTVQLNWWPEPKSPNRNWILEDITIRQNAGEGFRLNHLRDFTLRRVVSVDNGTQNHFIGSEGQIIDMVIERNGWRKPVDTFWNSLRNVYVHNSSFSHNNGNAFRNDHVAENLLIENSRFNGNSVQALTFETVIGPVTIRNSEVKNNNFGGGESDDSAVGLAMVHNLTLDGITFENNRNSALMFYPRERAHTANQEGHDELNNNLDVGHWDTDDTPEGRWTPGGKKPGSENRNFIIKNCTFLANSPNDRFIIQHFYRRGPAYQRNIRQELRAYNNRYYNPQNTRPFQLNNVTWRPDPADVYATFDEWKKVSTQPNFEAGSAWGTSAPRNFTPPKLQLATVGRNTAPKIVGGRMVYEVENLPFKATQPVEVLQAADVAANKVHKLNAVQVGDYGDWVEYSINVPQAGTYHMDVHYLQDAGPFNYLGYAQVIINGAAQGDWWDQHGLSRQMMSHHVGPVSLKAGVNTLRFESVWRNGYGSADYDITVDRIELSSTQALRPAATNAPLQVGLNYQLYAGGDWTRLPDFDSMKAEDSGTANSFDLSMAEELEKFGLRFTGFIDVPRDGIYTFGTLVNDGANLYIGNQLVVDADGVHDGEKHEPWLKRGNIALQNGRHPIRVDYFENGGKGKALEVLWAALGTELQPIAPAALGAIGVAATPRTVGPNLLNGNTIAMEPFKKSMKGDTTLEESGAWPQPWSANLWDKNSSGEVVLEKDPVTNRNAIVLRNLEGQSALQFYTWKNIDLPPGRYLMRFDYMTRGNDGAQFNLNFAGMDKQEHTLAASAKAWKRFSTTIDVKQIGVGTSPQFRNPASGADKALYIRSISLHRLAE